MSLAVSPSSSSPITHSRPLPPNRKRNSYTPSPRATPRITPKTSFVDDSEAITSGSKAQNATLGGLRERSEEELSRAGRDDLEEALRKEWDEREALLQRLDQIRSERKALEEKQNELLRDISSLQAKNDEAFNEQNRMEADLEERDELLDRLRKRLGEAERQVRESQKRYIEQEQTFEIERQALQAQENHLQQKIKSLSSASSSLPFPSRRSTTPTPPNESENITSLKDELASINLSHSTLLAKLNTITKESHKLKLINQELQDENEGWEFLIRERTLNGKLLEKGGLLSTDHIDQSMKEQIAFSGIEDDGSNTADVLDQDLEEEMSELNSDLENQSPIFDDDHHFFATDLGETSKKDDYLAPPNQHSGKRRRNRTPSNSSGIEGSRNTNSGLDLASELNMADDKSDGGQSGVSGNGRTEEVAALRAEVKQLKESNKALTLYCSKIIDRIITQEGFEQVLSVDYKTRRAGTRSASSSSRPALKDISSSSWGMTSSPISEEAPKLVEPEPVKEKKARPLSMMVRAMTGPAEKTVLPPTQAGNPPPIEVEGKEAKAEKRARRGFSLDFRSLGFGTSSYTSPPAAEPPKSTLRPLTLSSSRSSTSSANTLKSSNTARKLEIHDEDEEDRKERHRMEATLKLMGINRSSTSPSPTPSIQEEPLNEEVSLEGATWKVNGIPRASNSIRSSRSKSPGSGSITESQSHKSMFGGNGTTPLERLSSVIGINNDEDRFPIPLDQIEDSQQAIIALKAFDERESQRLKELAKGKQEDNRYTSPPKISSRRFSREYDDEQDRTRTISKSESINTLWSIGGDGDSRPGSGEIVIEKK